MSRYLHTAAEIAAALRAVAVRLDAMPDTELPDLAVTLSIQVCEWSTTDVAARIAAIDALAAATVAAPATTQQLGDGGWLNRTGSTPAPDTGGIDISVYGAVPAPADAGLTPAA